MIKALLLSPGPVLTCLLAIILLLAFFSLSVRFGFLYDRTNTRIFFAIISVICLRMVLPVNFPFTYSIYIRDFVRPVMDVLSASIADTPFMVFDCLYGIWAVGAVMQLCRFLKAKKVYTDRIREFIITKESSCAYLYDLAQNHSAKQVKIAVVPFPVSPGITGICNPVLILPEVDGFSKKELTYIFDHELYHYKKHDLALLLLIDIVCCIHWWNPLVYMMKKWFCLAMEITNDQAIMQGRDSADRLEYASLIIKISKKLQDAQNTPVYNLDFVGSRPSQLGLRIRYLYKDADNKTYLSAIRSLKFLFLTMLLVFSLFFVIESEATVTPADAEGSVVITEENSYFIKSENGYDLYVEGKYFTSFIEIPEEFKNLKIK
ncbi:M56 family metallopeptidase [Mordavella massiliensis]|uniref:M56 family metallopeptidase n=1 Tax=Mordavella massiliensis TaxID=1871024 RepID=A0A938XAJ8_9CLOT|nr:M56 family metallopeptidase [Mordavella massiliensis]MBM6947502.1 M56 family metallopeptidase [Mordavella massiliensis]